MEYPYKNLKVRDESKMMKLFKEIMSSPNFKELVIPSLKSIPHRKFSKNFYQHSSQIYYFGPLFRAIYYIDNKLDKIAECFWHLLLDIFLNIYNILNISITLKVKNHKQKFQKIKKHLTKVNLYPVLEDMNYTKAYV